MPEPRGPAQDSTATAPAVAATLAPGACWLVLAILTRQLDPTYYDASTTVDYLAVVLYSLALMLTAPAGVALHRRQASRAGLDERIGLWVLVIGAVGAGVGDFGEDGLRIWGGLFWFSGLLMLLVGLVLFGIGTMRARVLPLWCGGLLILSPVAALLPGGQSNDWLRSALFGLIWIPIGFTLLLHRRQLDRTQSWRY